MLKNYKELKVWQKAYQLCITLYKITKGSPKEERYGLISQIRRAAISVPSNIAEGYGRKTTQEYMQSLYIAYGSHCELETQIMLAKDLGYIRTEDFKVLQLGIGEVERMLKALIKSLQNKRLNPPALGIPQSINSKLRSGIESWTPPSEGRGDKYGWKSLIFFLLDPKKCLTAELSNGMRLHTITAIRGNSAEII
jgi:four helix bundle protein